MIDISESLRRVVADGCSDLFNIKCDVRHVKLGGKFADITLCVAFAYDKNTETLAEIIQNNINSFVFLDVPMLSSAEADGVYINMRMSDECLERIVNKINTELPKPCIMRNGRTGYAIARAYMLSLKSDEFYEWIKKPRWRFALIATFNSGLGDSSYAAAVDALIKAERKEVRYDGAGHISDAIARMLEYNYKGGEEK